MLNETELREGLGRMIRVSAEDVPQSLVDSLIDEASLGAAFEAALDAPEVAATRTTINFFQVYLGRLPAAAGLDFWADKLNAGTPGDSTDDPLPTVISEFFVNSPEFFAQFGDVPSPESVVVDMFQNVLNRAPAFDGLTFWADATRIRIQEFKDAGLSQAEAEKAAFSRLALDFVFAQETENRFAPGIDTLLIELANGNEDALDPGESLFDATGTFRAGIEQVGARQYELTLDDSGEEVAPFTLNGGAESTDRLRLIGDKDVRIDLTDAAEQLEGIDIDGSGAIEFDEQDQAFRDAVNVGFFEIFDAHPRGDALLDPSDSTDGFTGDIFFDGTGFAGDGRATNGNIVLGGSGDDTIFTGIGNDFVSTGGGNDEVKLGRNADFLVQELSRLDDAFTGDDVELDGGSTFDNDPGQDNDWLLLEAGDDEEPVTVNFSNVLDTNGDGFVDSGSIQTTGANDAAAIRNFENLNASGNFFKFLAIKDQTDPTPNDIIGKVIGVGSTAFNNVNEFYGAISSIELPLGDETLSIGAGALADANDFDTVLAAVKAAFEARSEDGEGNPTVEVRAGTDASGPVIEIVDLAPEGRDFGTAEVEGSFGELAGGFAFRQDDILPVGGEFEINALFDDVFFGDNRDFTETKTRVPGLSVGVTAQMVVQGDGAENTVIAGYDNDRVDGDGGDDLLFGGDLEFLLTHKNNPNLFDVANDLITVNTEGDGVADVGRDTLIGGDGEDDIVWDAAGGSFDGGRAGTAEVNPLGNDAAAGFDPFFSDTLWVTAFSVGRLADIGLDATTDASLGTDGGGIGNNDGLNEFLGVDGDGVEARQDFTGLAEQPREQDAADALTSDGVLRFDLGVGRGFDIQGQAGGTPVRGGIDGADRLGTADQTNYRDGVPFTTVTDIENLNASGLGAIDYRAAGTNDPDLFFENQQNYRGTSLDIDIRGVDDIRINPGTDEQGEDSTPARAGDFSLDQLIAEFNTGTATASGAPIADLVYAGSGADDAVFGPGVQSPAENELFTSRGDDVLEGRGGNDWLEGRAGDDIFVVSLNDGDNFAGGDTPFGDDVNVIARRQDADADGLLDVTADGRTVIGQDFRPFDTTITELLPRVFAIDATGVFNIEGQVDDYTALQSITFVFSDGTDSQTLNLPANNSIETAAELAAFLQGALPLLEIGVQGVAVGQNNLDENGVFNDETDPGDPGDSVQVTFEPGSSISNVIVQGTPPQGDENGGFAANEVPEDDVTVDLVEDDEVVFRSYQNRLDDELIPDRLASLGRDALAEDLVFGVENGTTKLVEDQQYQIAIDDLKDGDTVSIRFNGETYSSTVGFDAVTGQDIAGESTEAFVARFVAEIQAEIARDPHSRDGNLALTAAQLGTSNSATITVREAATANDGGEHVFIRFPQVSIENNSGGDAPRHVVRETSETSVVLYDYDWRDDATVNTGLNRGVGVNAQRGEANDDRFITFEGDTGINRAILQNNVAGETLSGLDVVTFANRATAADADFANENDLTRDVLNGDQDGYLGADNVTPENNPSNPGNAGGTIGQPSGSNPSAPLTFSALQGDDNLIGSDGDDTIEGRTGDDRVTATRTAGPDGDVYDGGVNIAINESTGQIQVANGELVQLRRSSATAVLMPFVDALIAREGGPADDQEFGDGSLFAFTVTGTADDYSLDGTLAVDEFGDGTVDHSSAFSNFEVLRTISDTERDSLSFAIDVDADTGGVVYDNSANAGDLNFVEVGNAGDDGVFGTGDDLDVNAQVQGVENVTGTAEDDILLGGTQDETLSGGAGDDLIDGGAGDDVLDGGAGEDDVSGGDGDDSAAGGDGDDLVAGDDGDDLVQGGAGVDTVTGDDGNDTVEGGAGNDLLDGGAGADAVNGDGGDDVILNAADGDDGSLGDTLDGGSGDDAFHLDEGFDDANGNGVQDAGEATFVDNDAVIGGDGQDVLNVNGFPAGPVTLTFRANAGDSADEDFDGAPATALTLDLLVEGVRTQVAVNGFDANDAASIAAAARTALVAAEIAATGAGASVVLPAGVFVNDIDTGAARAPSADVSQGAGVDVQLLGEGAIDVEKINLNDGELTVSDNTIVNETSVVFGNASGLEIVAVDNAATNFLTSSNLTVASIDLAFGGVTLTGGAGDDTLTGSADTAEDGGLDFGEVFAGGDGDDSIVGNTGDDDADGGAGDDTVNGGTGFDILEGGLGDDSLVGGDDADLLLGDDDGASAPDDHGNDTLEGGAGADALFGEGGDDLLDGGDDDDDLFGEEGDDALIGGAGSDLLESGADDDTLDGGSGDDALFGDAGDDVLTGGEGVDQLFGGDGDDVLDAGAGDEGQVSGGAGNDVVNGGEGADVVAGDAGDDTVDGGAGDDLVLGGDGDDVVRGGNGEDVVDGGAGDDTLSGGNSIDLFFADASGAERDVITDFATTDDPAATLDTIDLVNLNGIATGFGTFSTIAVDGSGADELAGPGLTVIVNNSGAGFGDAASLSAADVAALFEDLGDGSALLFGASPALVAVSNNIDTGIFRIENLDGSDVISADEITEVLRLEGIEDTSVLTDDDFADFTAVPPEAPEAGDDTATVAEDATVVVDVLANDTDPQGQALSVAGLDTAGTQGTVTDNGDGTVTYDPNGAFDALEDGQTGTDSFAYTVTDTDGNTDTATVTVTVTGVTPPPIPTTQVTGTGTFAAQAGPELFVVAVDNSGGPITNPDFDGVATITGFDPAEDRLVFENEPGSTVTANDFLTSNGVDVLENPFSNTVSYVFGDDPAVPGTDGATVVIDGLSEQDANNDNVLDFIDIA